MTATLIPNPKVHFNYEILESFEAGIELFGHEVKSLRAQHGSLEGAYVTVRGSEAFLIGMTIPPYQPGNLIGEYDPMRNRRLLLTKQELLQLGKTEVKKGLTIVPISVYNKGHKIKVSIGIARGKKKYDKRETLKKRDTEREISRQYKDR